MVRQNFPAPIFGLLFWLIFVSTGRTQNGGTWQTRAPMPVSRQELATGVLNGKVYVVGGYDADAHSTATVQVYNPTTDTWTLRSEEHTSELQSLTKLVCRLLL